jgi:SAM-dependent methyltransferase
MAQGRPPEDPAAAPRGDFYTQVDRAADPGGFLRHLAGFSALPTMQEQKRLTYELLRPRPGARLLDVGCGPGDDVLALAALVGPTGRVVGVDNSATMLAEARRRAAAAAGAGGAGSVEFRAGDAAALAFPNGSFDGARAERVLEHLTDPEGALAELVRVVRPGGRVVAVSPDFEGYPVDHPDRERTRAIMQWPPDRLAGLWMGRRLYGLFKAAGLTEVTVAGRVHVLTELFPADRPNVIRGAAQGAARTGRVTEAEAAAWIADLEAASAAGRFFAATTHFIAAGSKA